MSQECYVGGTMGFEAPPFDGPASQGMCPPGYFCPHSNASDPNTWPRFCPATDDCLATRADRKFCGPQGPFEPVPCPSGSYCPTGFEQLPCPKGKWCPLGTTIPNNCNGMMYCPEGLAEPPYDYSSILATILLDALIAFGVVMLARRRRGMWYRADEVFAKRQNLVELKESDEELDELLSDTDDDEDAIGGKKSTPKEKAQARARSRDPMSFAILERGIRANRAQMMPLHIQFEQLSVAVPVKKGHKQLLKGITGAIMPGHVTAIMGPSGAGKTVFMTSLLNKVESNWKVTGNITINGANGSTLRDYQHVLGYVPQDDVMHPELTVLENVWFSSESRLPRDWSPEDRLRYVTSVISATGLEEVRHVVVGDGSVPNGVNRKRVCIAMELAAAPAALFLDEPTTGLDAATALDLCYLLKDAAVRSQLTVAMVIHQPRVQIWESLDEVLLLAPGGRTVYQGPQSGAQSYFSHCIGLDFASGNPADIILDGISANQEACEQAWESFLIANPNRFTVMGGEAAPSSPNQETSMPREESTRADRDKAAEVFLTNINLPFANQESAVPLRPEAPVATHATAARQFALVHYRSLLKQLAHLPSIILGIVLSIVSAAVMGAASVRKINVGILDGLYAILNPRQSLSLIPMMMMFYFIAIASSTSASAIRALGDDRQQYWKEAATGRTNKLAYFLAMTTGEIYRLLLTSMHFALVAYFMFNPMTDFWWFFFILLLAFMANDSQGAMLGLAMSPKHAPLLTTVAAVFVSLLNGFPNIPGITFAGYTFYLTEVAINRYVVYQDHIQPSRFYEGEHFSYKVNRLGTSLAIVIAITVFYRIVAFLIMTLTNRNKQR